MEKLIYWKKIPLINNILNLILKYNREKIHKLFLKYTNYNKNLNLLDVGTTSIIDENHNLILYKTRDNENISCFSNQDLEEIKKKFINIKNTYKGDGKKMQLDDNTFNIVYSSATIEHIGSFENQVNFLKECCRVSNDIIFITTPNRYYPIDFHTKIPLLHWLPKKIHRKLLKFLKMDFYSNEENLNLLSKKDILKILNILNIKNYKILKNRFLFFTANLILVIKKNT